MKKKSKPGSRSRGSVLSEAELKQRKRALKKMPRELRTIQGQKVRAVICPPAFFSDSMLAITARPLTENGGRVVRRAGA